MLAVNSTLCCSCPLDKGKNIHRCIEQGKKESFCCLNHHQDKVKLEVGHCTATVSPQHYRNAILWVNSSKLLFSLSEKSLLHTKYSFLPTPLTPSSHYSFWSTLEQDLECFNKVSLVARAADRVLNSSQSCWFDRLLCIYLVKNTSIFQDLCIKWVIVSSE